jgi:hypothetical protein
MQMHEDTGLPGVGYVLRRLNTIIGEIMGWSMNKLHVLCAHMRSAIRNNKDMAVVSRPTRRQPF